MNMSEVWTNFQALVSNPNATAEEHRAFWASLEVEFSKSWRKLAE